MTTFCYYCRYRSRIGSKFGKIRPETEELAALERLVKIPIYFQRENGVTYLESAFILRWIVYQAGSKDNYKSLDEYEFWQDSITGYGVSYPPASEKSMYDVVTTVGHSFLIGSLFLQATTAINTHHYLSNLIWWIGSRRVAAPGAIGSHEMKSSLIQ